MSFSLNPMIYTRDIEPMPQYKWFLTLESDTSMDEAVELEWFTASYIFGSDDLETFIDGPFLSYHHYNQARSVAIKMMQFYDHQGAGVHRAAGRGLRIGICSTDPGVDPIVLHDTSTSYTADARL